MVHCFSYKDLNIAVDTYSGAVHLLDKPALAVVEVMEKEGGDPHAQADWEKIEEKLKEEGSIGSADTVTEAVAEVRELVDQDLLFTEDSFQPVSDALLQRPSYVKALCLNVAHSCNLDCDYCFASQGKYHGPRSLMSFEVAKQAVDFLVASSGPHCHLDIDYFGGEPLLNWEVVKKTTLYAESIQEGAGKEFRFTLTTNGLLLDEEVTAFLNQHMHNVVLSLDGRETVHNRFRHHIDGRGSYQEIVPRFQQFVQSRGQQEYYIRGTYTRYNRDFTEDIFHMADLGFHRLSMEPVIGSPDEDYMLTEEDVPFLLKQYDRLTDEMIRREIKAEEAEAAGRSVEDLPLADQPFVFYHFMLNLDHGPCIYKRVAGCGSGTEYLAVTPWGELFPCHQFIGEPAFSAGNVFDGISRPEALSDFKTCNCYSRPQCQDCWAKLYCSGGCAANAYHVNGSIQGIVPFSCQLFRKRMECALAIQASAAVRQAEREETAD